jgi:PKD repeat protein
MKNNFMKITRYVYFILLLAPLLITSCDDDAVPPQSAAVFTASATTAKVDEEIQFTNTSTNATAFRWSFGDGTTSKEVSPKKAYEASGKFLVSLVSTGEGGSTISNMEVTIVPDAAFEIENADDLFALSPVQFTNTSKGATSYEWSFGTADNNTSTDESPEFSYLAPGTYTVTLTAISAFGESTATKQVTVGSADPALYFIEYDVDFIRQLALNETAGVSNFLDIAGKVGVGIAYDHINGKVYFSDFNLYGSGKIWKINIDGSGLEAIVSDLYDPYGVALDLVHGKIYWAEDVDESDIGHIVRANLDGTGKETLVSLPDGQFRAIALDVENNKMYYYDVNAEDLYSANLDGSGATPIISGVYGYAIAVDTEHDKIYFDDQNDAQLKRANLNGSGVEMVDDTDTRIYGIVIDNEGDKLYWSGRDSGEIYISDLDGSNQETLKSGLESPRGIFIRK